MMKSTTIATLVDGAIALAIVTAATVLLALHDLSEPTALALFGVGITLVGGSAKALLALKVPAPAQPVAAPAVQQAPPPQVP